MPLNRYVTLKYLLDRNAVPIILDFSIGHDNYWTWGDLEKIGYGFHIETTYNLTFIVTKNIQIVLLPDEIWLCRGNSWSIFPYKLTDYAPWPPQF